MKKVLSLTLCLMVSVLLIQTMALAQEAPAPTQPAAQEKPAGEATPPPAQAQAEKKAPTAEELLKESDTLWRKRAKKGNAKLSITKAEEAMKAGASAFDGNWRIARGAFWVAEWGNKKTKEQFGEKGWKAGLIAQKEKPGRVEGWYFGGVALAQYAKAVGVAAALFRGLGNDYTSMLEKAIKLNKRYGMGGPLRGYGRYFHQVPWPKKDVKKSIELLEESRKIAPKKLRTHFYLAESYKDDGQEDKAKQMLETCVSLSPKNEEYADGIRFLPKCKKMLATMK